MDAYSPIEYRDKIANITNDAIVLCNIPNHLISITKEFFPYLIHRDKGFNYDFYCFSKKSTNTLEEFYFTSIVDFESGEINFEKGYSSILKDTSSLNHYYQFINEMEWGPVIEIPLSNIIKDKYCIIETQASINTSSLDRDGHLVFEIKNKDDNIVWYSSELSNFISKTNQWEYIYFSNQLNLLGGAEKITENSILKVYFWNKDKKPISIDNLSIKIKNGNHKIYSQLYNYQ